MTTLPSTLVAGSTGHIAHHNTLHVEHSRDIIATFGRTGVLKTPDPGVLRVPMLYAATIVGLMMTIDTAPVGAAVIADINLNGTTIYTTQANRVRILAGAFSTVAPPLPDIVAIPANSYLTMDIDQIGSTTAGANLVLRLYGELS